MLGIPNVSLYQCFEVRLSNIKVFDFFEQKQYCDLFFIKNKFFSPMATCTGQYIML